LNDEQRQQPKRGSAQLRFLRMESHDARHRPDHEYRHDQRAASMGEVHVDENRVERRHEMAVGQRKIGDSEACAQMAHHRADQNLDVDNGGRDRRQRCEPRPFVIRGNTRMRTESGIREHRKRNRDAEERLRRGGMCDRDRKRQLQQDRDSTQPHLDDDKGEGGEGSVSHPFAALGKARPDREHEGEGYDDGCDHAMAVFEPHAIDEFRNQMSEGERPIRHRECGASRRDESSDEYEDKRHRRGQDRQAMKPKRRRNAGVVASGRNHGGEMRMRRDDR